QELAGRAEEDGRLVLEPLRDEERRDRGGHQRGERETRQRGHSSTSTVFGTSNSQKWSSDTPSRAHSATRIEPPWQTISAGVERLLRTSSIPARTRSWCSCMDSPPGNRKLAPARRNAANPSGSRASISGKRKPSHSPRNDSAKRESTTGVRPTAAPTISAVSRARLSCEVYSERRSGR